MKKLFSVVCLFALFASFARAQHKRDPLTEPEVDQLRETAQEPDKRLKLMVKFARARMLAIDQLRSDPKVADEAKDYEFVLDNTLEAVNQSVDNARKTLDEQNEEFAKKKKK